MPGCGGANGAAVVELVVAGDDAIVRVKFSAGRAMSEARKALGIIVWKAASFLDNLHPKDRPCDSKSLS